jgi:hypothetical protein
MGQGQVECKERRDIRLNALKNLLSLGLIASTLLLLCKQYYNQCCLKLLDLPTLLSWIIITDDERRQQ